MLYRKICRLAIALTLLVPSLYASAEERQYPFVAQGAGNSFGNYVCLGIASGIECLEQGTKVEGLESSEDLARRIWDHLLVSNSDPLVYYAGLRLRDGTTVPTCSKAAIEEIGFLVQKKFSDLVQKDLWQEDVEHPDPNTPEGRDLLKTRQAYVDLTERNNESKITNAQQLKDIVNEDEDGLVALSGRGQRIFFNGPPKKLIEKHGLQIDPRTGKYQASVPSYHAFLLTYVEDSNQFYAFDSDDPDGKWPVTVEGSGDQFRIGWRIDDHMGNGPSLQVYYDVRPQKKLLRDVQDIIQSDD